MSLFRYQALTRTGDTVAGDIECAGEREALLALQRRGLTVTSVTTATEASARPASPRKAQLKPNDRSTLLREWATLLSAGLTVDDALAISGVDSRSKAIRSASDQIRRRIREGRAFHDALLEHGLLDREDVVLVEAGEASGSLPRVMDQLATDIIKRQDSREGFVTALLYPAVLLASTAVAIGVIVLIVAPNLAELFSVGHGSIPPQVSLLLAFSDLVRVGSLPLVLVTALLVAAFLIARRSATGRLAQDRALLRVPFIGQVLWQSDAARFAAVGALMTSCGVVPTKALPLAASALRNAHLRTSLSNALTLVSRGANVDQALAQSKALPPELQSLVAAGMRTGRLSTVLQHGSDMLSRRAEATTKRFAALLTPTITVLAGLVIGGLAYCVMTAVVSLNEVAYQ